MLEGTDIDALIRMFEQSGWKELELQIDGTDIFLSKSADGRSSWRTVPSAVPAPSPSVAPKEVSTAQQPALASTGAPAAAAAPAGHAFVTAPSLGTFFRAAKPGSPPFIEVGQVVTADTELCLIEVMKLFTTLRAGVDGTVADVLAKDGDVVEFGQPLFLIKLDA